MTEKRHWRRVLSFFRHVERQCDGCWRWTGALNGEGYSNFSVPGIGRSAHRFAYVAFVGPVPAGLTLDHLCRNRACVRPEHLEPVSNRENVLRGIGISAKNAVKVACLQGHPYSAENTYVTPDGRRGCRTCRRAAEKAYAARQAAGRYA